VRLHWINECSRNDSLPGEDEPLPEDIALLTVDNPPPGGGDRMMSDKEDGTSGDYNPSEQTGHTDDDLSEENIRRLKWKRKHKFDEPLHPALSLTKFEVFLMIFHLFIRHNLTYALVEDILKLINCIFGAAVLTSSQYMFRKLFKPKGKMSSHIYCSKCEEYLGEQSELKCATVTCECGQKNDVSKLGDNYFVTISIADSLKYLM